MLVCSTLGESDDPASWPVGVWSGQVSVAVPIITVVLVAAMAAAGVWLWRRISGGTAATLKPYRVAAGEMVDPRRLEQITENKATCSRDHLVPALKGTSGPVGIKLGTTLRRNMPVYLDWESTLLVVAGPRMGKTQAIALPAIATAPGAVIATSNKPDIYALSHQYRRTRGRVWCFDPQDVAAGVTNFWWNPLGRVRELVDAERLAGWLTSAIGKSDTANQTNKYFDDEGERVLAYLIMAAAVGGGDLVHVFEWLQDFHDQTPVTLLRDAGLSSTADSLTAVQTMEYRQRDGIVGFARQPVALLNHRRFAQLVTPPQRVRFVRDDDGLLLREPTEGLHDRELAEFVPAEFPDSTDTLYALSRDTGRSAAGLLTALTAEVLEEAVDHGARHGGRLPVPMVAVLDEVANICRMAELPRQVSHFGSRGVITITILQSPGQARGVWGAEGWDALRSSSAAKLYGGNVSDEAYLRDLSAAVGHHSVAYGSRSTSSSGVSHSTNVHREPILESDDLEALPKQLALLQTPGNRPVLVRKDFIFNNRELNRRMRDDTTSGEEAK
ncbi:hypothetical protein CXF35_00630 [Corynebacterium bovis]|uniref:TraD/TraG TraM recognition site domain-containing protein n=3 Tax=Corynebacterium bovis TaxID=36808 RepID=A0A426Q416_9CORY|nr:hypothetical protein CXF40_03075 [Corynebacterium bovis]RRO99695.1 hypothetical protein CXF41_09045 [Corynebacterium bovis]RRQ03516.1 hypothetical protein CXF42_06845 [Corynebacterium bovis]RRQ04905.1 hypothetical protein CXF39_00705 [Corynebacterium bovis]RRQ13521.1 hypothetical protein CXF34_00475 [Corynebacterium bovis]